MMLVFWILIMAAGLAAGTFLALIPMLILTVLGVGAFIAVSRDDDSLGLGMGLAMVYIIILSFLVPMWLATAFHQLVDLDTDAFSRIGAWLKRYLLR